MKTILFNWKDDIDIQKIHSCKNLVGLFIKSLPRRTFEQMIHNFGYYLNDVSLHKEEIKYVMNNIILKNTECCTRFSLLGFYPKGFFLVRF